MKAQRALEAEGRISLPEARCDLRIAESRLLEATSVQADVRRIRDLEIVLARSREDRAIWNTLVEREHPQATKKLAGTKLPFLGAAALYLKPRDAS